MYFVVTVEELLEIHFGIEVGFDCDLKCSSSVDACLYSDSVEQLFRPEVPNMWYMYT